MTRERVSKWRKLRNYRPLTVGGRLCWQNYQLFAKTFVNRIRFQSIPVSRRATYEPLNQASNRGRYFGSCCISQHRPTAEEESYPGFSARWVEGRQCAARSSSPSTSPSEYRSPARADLWPASTRRGSELCGFSRAPEIIFDQGLGDLFVVRVAGNVATEAELASLEYGADHLHIPLLVVVGHENCGAVTAALQGGPAEGHISTLVQLLQPAVEKSRQLPGDALANAVRTNVEMVVQQLRTSTPILSELVAHHKLKIIGAVYSLKTGRVSWLPDDPRYDDLRTRLKENWSGGPFSSNRIPPNRFVPARVSPLSVPSNKFIARGRIPFMNP